MVPCRARKNYELSVTSSSTEDICTHDSSTDCFQSSTLWSPVDTASTLPVTDQLTRHTGASKFFISVGIHCPSRSLCFHMNTVLSSEQLAIILNGMPVLGAQATSLTQSRQAGRQAGRHRKRRVTIRQKSFIQSHYLCAGCGTCAPPPKARPAEAVSRCEPCCRMIQSRVFL